MLSLMKHTLCQEDTNCWEESMAQCKAVKIGTDNQRTAWWTGRLPDGSAELCSSAFCSSEDPSPLNLQGQPIFQDENSE